MQPFIATLAALWITRGLCFFISDDAISIDNPIYKILSQTKILIPGLSNPTTKEGAYISLLVVLAPNFQMRGYTVGKKTDPTTQLIYVECKGAKAAPGAKLSIKYSYVAGEYNYYKKEDGKWRWITPSLICNTRWPHPLTG